MAKLVKQSTMVSEKDPHRPWVANGLKPLMFGAGIVAAYLLVSSATRAKAHSYTVTATDASCEVAYVGSVLSIDGTTVSAEVSVTCPRQPSTMTLTVRLQHLSGGKWADVGTEGKVAMPPTATTYAYAKAPCAIGEFRAVYTLTGTGKATGQTFSYPATAGDTRTVNVGECR